MSACRSCEAPILFAFTVKGHRMPFDNAPVGRLDDTEDLHGLFVLREDPETGKLMAVSAVSVDTTAADDELFVSHFATCPNAASHRRSRGTLET